MCGIAGIINWNKADKPYNQMLADMCDEMAHRGPDGWGYAVSRGADTITERVFRITEENSGIFLGHRRLSIIDLSNNGHQPMVSKDGSLIITFNGEIYNYLELKETLQSSYHFISNSDTEVLMAAYIKWGHKMLNKLDGMFSFAIYDKVKRKVFAARDAIGIKPFYYTKTNQELFFGSEPKVVLKGLRNQGKLDIQRTSEFFILGVSDHDDGTFISQVNQLKGGHYLMLNIDTGGLTIEEYWKPQKSLKSAEENDFTEYLSIARKAITRQLRSDVPLGSSLSGGIDSSTIVTLAGEILGEHAKNYKALTFTFPDFAEDESHLAKTVARNAGIEWYEVIPSMDSLSSDLEKMICHMGEPFTTLSMFAQYKVMQKASELGLKVMLDGQGGDEVYMGYERMVQRVFSDYLKQHQYSKAYKEWIGLRDHLSVPLWKSLAMSVYFDSATIRIERRRRKYSKYVNQELLSSYRKDVIDDFYANKPIEDKQIDELRYYCLPRLLRFADRNSMAFSVEQRVPHLSNLILDYALQLPISLRVHNGWSKFIVRQSMNGKVPDEILWATKKRGFDIPQEFWVARLAPKLKEWIGDTADQQLFNKDAIIQDVETPESGSPYLWSVVSTILFMHFSKIQS